MRSDREIWRRVLFWVLLASFIGTGGELLLLEHTEDFWQWLPLVLLGLGSGALVLRVLVPRAWTIRLIRLLMGLFLVTGSVGLYLHYRGNAEFELEMYPTLAGLELFWEALKGATPTLAPAAMVQFGFLGLAYCFRHPLSRKPESSQETAG